MLPAGRLGGRLRQRRRGAAHLVVPDGEVPGSGRHGPEPGHRQRAAAAARSRSATASRTSTRSRSTTESVYPHAGRRPSSASARRPGKRSRLTQFYPPDRGRYRFRISASGVSERRQAGHLSRRRPAGMRMAGKSGLVGYFDAPADKPTVVEFVEYMEPRTTISHPPLRAGRRADRAQDRRRQVRRDRGWRCSGSRWKGRCTTPGRRRAIAASSATCRRSRRRSTTTASASRSSRRTPRPTPSASCATSPAAPFAAAVTDDDVEAVRRAGQGEAGRRSSRSSRRCASA